MLLDVSNRSPRTVLVLLDLAGLDEVAQDALSVEAVFQLLLALLDLGLVLLELGELLLNRSVLSCLLYTSPSPRDGLLSRMPSSA